MTALYAIPSLLLLAVTCIVGVALAVALQIWVHRTFKQTDFLTHNEVSGFMIAVVGTLYAVTLAFVVSIVWAEYDGSAARTAMEAGNGAIVWRVAVGLPEPLAARLRGKVVNYARLMIDDEWPLMLHGSASPRGEALVTDLLREIAVFRPANAGEANIQAQELQSLERMHEARHERLADNTNGISPFQWIILVLGASIVIGFCFLFGLPNQTTHNLMTGAVACLIAATFVLIFELDYPFHGDLGISPDPWKDFLRSIGSNW